MQHCRNCTENIPSIWFHQQQYIGLHFIGICLLRYLERGFTGVGEHVYLKSTRSAKELSTFLTRELFLPTVHNVDVGVSPSFRLVNFSTILTCKVGLNLKQTIHRCQSSQRLNFKVYWIIDYGEMVTTLTCGNLFDLLGGVVPWTCFMWANRVLYLPKGFPQCSQG